MHIINGYVHGLIWYHMISYVDNELCQDQMVLLFLFFTESNIILSNKKWLLFSMHTVG